MHEKTIKGGNNMRFKDARALHKGDEVTLKGSKTPLMVLDTEVLGKQVFLTLEGGPCLSPL